MVGVSRGHASQLAKVGAMMGTLQVTLPGIQRTETTVATHSV